MKTFRFFDKTINKQRVHECARIAELEKEISMFPMGYHTPIGDLGSSLSGGQIQRVLLARALYPKPNILLFDEGTAHLDRFIEEKIMTNLKSLEITQIYVAHRPASFVTADNIFVVKDKNVMLHNP